MTATDFSRFSYYCRDGEFAISSSIPRLIEAGAPIEVDEPALAVFLRLGFFIGDDTPYKHIRALPPGATLVWDGALQLDSPSHVFGAPQGVTSRATWRSIPILACSARRSRTGFGPPGISSCR
jgi:hypothetical protein